VIIAGGDVIPRALQNASVDDVSTIREVDCSWD
jgi:hypothetical protein